MKSLNKTQPLKSLFRNILLFVFAVYLIALFYLWHLNLEATRIILNHTSSVLTQGIRTTLKGHDLILRGLGEELLENGALDNPEQGRDLIERMRNIDPGMVGFGLARTDGQLVLVSGIGSNQKLPNLTEQEHTKKSFLEVLNSQHLQTGRPYFFKALNHWVLPIRTPVFDKKGELRAVMTAGYKIHNATTSWSNTELPQDTRALLMRNDGYLIFTQPLLPGETKTQSLLKTYGEPVSSVIMQRVTALNKKNAFITIHTPRLTNASHYLSYRYIPEYNLHTGVQISTNAVLSSWLQRIIIPSLLFIIFIIGGSLAFRRTLQKQTSADDEIKQLSAWQNAVLDGADYSIISTDTEGTIVSFNPAAQRLLGYTADEVVGKHTPGLFHDENEVIQRAEKLSAEMGKLISPGFEVFIAKALLGQADEQEFTYIHKDGSKIPVILSVTAMYADNHEIIGFLGIAANLSEKLTMLTNLEDSESRYRALFDSAGDAIFLMMDDRFVDCNPATLNMFGCKREDIINTTPQRYSPEFQPDGRSSTEKALEKIHAAFAGQAQSFEWRHLKFDGTPFDAEVTLNAVVIYDQPQLLATVRDITVRKQFEDELTFQARHDSLTGLPNRTTLHEAFDDFKDKATACGKSIALLLFDLDRFKEVNDTLGHHAGDEVLLQIGPRLNTLCEDKDAVISRLGGDEFAIIVIVDTSRNEITAIAEQLVNALRESFTLESINVRVGASVGIACYPEHGTNSHELLRAADVAMYQAKKSSSGVKFYDHESDIYSTKRLALASELTQAIQNKQLVLHYQPKIDISTGKTESFEALVRWQHPEHGLLYPDAFIDLVEMSDVIQSFTQAIIELAVTEKKKLNNLGFDQSVAINLSARNLVDDACFNVLKGALLANDLASKEIELELTESALMHDPETAITSLQQFKDIGIQIAIDDFGTGYSSLSYLRKLPVSALKIDRSFVIEMANNSQDKAIVQSTIALAHILDLKVIAEGVEDDQSLSLLKSMQCDLAQGYGICRPQPLELLIEWLSKNDSAA